MKEFLTEIVTMLRDLNTQVDDLLDRVKKLEETVKGLIDEQG